MYKPIHPLNNTQHLPTTVIIFRFVWTKLISMTVCSYHVSYSFQSEFTLCSTKALYLKFKWLQRGSNLNQLVRKRTRNHFAQLAKWLSSVVSAYLYSAFECMFLSCKSNTVKCTVEISTHNTAQSFGHFGLMVKCSFTN